MIFSFHLCVFCLCICRCRQGKYYTSGRCGLATHQSRVCSDKSDVHDVLVLKASLQNERNGSMTLGEEPIELAGNSRDSVAGRNMHPPLCFFFFSLYSYAWSGGKKHIFAVRLS